MHFLRVFAHFYRKNQRAQFAHIFFSQADPYYREQQVVHMCAHLCTLLCKFLLHRHVFFAVYICAHFVHTKDARRRSGVYTSVHTHFCVCAQNAEVKQVLPPNTVQCAHQKRPFFAGLFFPILTTESKGLFETQKVVSVCTCIFALASSKSLNHISRINIDFIFCAQ